MLLLADANVLIDLYHVKGLSLAPKIAPTQVLDYVVNEIDRQEQPGIRAEIEVASISIVPVQLQWLEEIKAMQHTGLSLQDKLNLHIVHKRRMIMLSGEKRLRTICNSQNIEIHGTLWLVEELHKRRIHPTQELCNWLTRLSMPDRYLPEAEIQRLFRVFDCKNAA